MLEDYYEILQVSRWAEPEVIRAAYNGLAKKYHPDLTGDPNGDARMKVINKAYEVLGDPIRRAEYDAELDSAPPKTAVRRPYATAPLKRRSKAPLVPFNPDASTSTEWAFQAYNGLGLAGPSGQLICTMTRLVFQPVKAKDQACYADISLSTIVDVRARNVLALFPSGIVIATTNGKHMYTVARVIRDFVIRRLTDTISALYLPHLSWEAQAKGQKRTARSDALAELSGYTWLDDIDADGGEFIFDQTIAAVYLSSPVARGVLTITSQRLLFDTAVALNDGRGVEATWPDVAHVRHVMVFGGQAGIEVRFASSRSVTFLLSTPDAHRLMASMLRAVRGAA